MKTRIKIKAGLAAIAAVTGIGLAAGVPATVANQTGQAGTVAKRSVSANQAARIAERRIQRRTGLATRVLRVRRVSSYGAMWDITVQARSGTKFDVYVADTGRVTRVDKVSTSQS